MKAAFIDAGVANMGVAIMERNAADPFEPYWTIAELELIQTQPNPRKKHMRAADDDLARVMECARRLDAILARHDIKRVAAEIPSGAQSAAAMKWMSFGAAVVGSVVALRDLYFEPYSQGEVKQVITGKATGAKEDVLAAMERKWPQAIEQFPQKDRREHVLDALAVHETAMKLGNICKL